MSTMESNARALAKPARADMYTCIHVQPFHCYADIDYKGHLVYEAVTKDFKICLQSLSK